MVERGVRLPSELYQNRHLNQEMSGLILYAKAMMFCLESRLTGGTHITNFMFGSIPKFLHISPAGWLAVVADGRWSASPTHS